MKPISCKYKRNRSVSQVLFLFFQKSEEGRDFQAWLCLEIMWFFLVSIARYEDAMPSTPIAD
jgi:hypothetical protein